MRDAIKYLFPDILEAQFVLQDDGAGPYIRAWTYPATKPTKQQLDATSAVVAILNARKAMIVSRFQALAAIYAAGLLDTAEAYFADPETPKLEKLAWANAKDFYRASPLVVSVGTILGLNDAQLDDLFTSAAAIQV